MPRDVLAAPYPPSGAALSPLWQSREAHQLSMLGSTRLGEHLARQLLLFQDLARRGLAGWRFLLLGLVPLALLW